MKTISCEYEYGILSARRSGIWTEPLKRHFASCIECQATISLSSALKSYAQQAIRLQRAIPSPRLAYIRYQLIRKEEKLSLLDIITVCGMGVMSVTAFVALLIWKLPVFLTTWPKIVSTVFQAPAGNSVFPEFWILGAGGVLVLLILLAAHHFYSAEG